MSELIDIFRGPPPDGPGCADVLFDRGGDTAPMGLYARIEFGAGKSRVPRSAIKVEIPPFRQQSNYSCGAAALAAVCEYFGVGPRDRNPETVEKDYIRAAKSDPQHGTKPEHIADAARKLGLEVVYAGDGMTLDELTGHLSRGLPVICDIQAWGNHPQGYATDEDDGHYVVAIGFDDGHIYFEDPSIEQTRGFMRKDHFDMRWHDKEDSGETTSHWGLVLDRPDEEAEEIG